MLRLTVQLAGAISEVKGHTMVSQYHSVRWQMAVWQHIKSPLYTWNWACSWPYRTGGSELTQSAGTASLGPFEP